MSEWSSPGGHPHCSAPSPGQLSWLAGVCRAPSSPSLFARDGLLAAAATVRADADAARDQRCDIHRGCRLAGFGCVLRVVAAQRVRHQVLVLGRDQAADHRLAVERGRAGTSSGVSTAGRGQQRGVSTARWLAARGQGARPGGTDHHDDPENAQHRAAHTTCRNGQRRWRWRQVEVRHCAPRGVSGPERAAVSEGPS